jgi:hypothetical protein
MMAVHRLQDSSQAHAGLERTPAESEKLKAEVAMYKAEAEKVSLYFIWADATSFGGSHCALCRLPRIVVSPCTRHFAQLLQCTC